MALIQCEDCRQQISDKADSCPNCGAPVIRKNTCPDCGSINDTDQTKCSICGCPIIVIPVVQPPVVAKPAPTKPQNKTTDPTTPMPAELRYFNWGAFFLWPLWGFANGCWWLFFIPMTGFFISLFLFWLFVPFLIIYLLTTFILGIIFGANGNSMAWRNKRWNSIEHFKSVQRTWGVVGLFIFIGTIIISLMMVGTIVTFIGSNL